ncbi:MAG: hypothetical protein AB7E47_06035 [Desulfovibrionaceae bacterium]
MAIKKNIAHDSLSTSVSLLEFQSKILLFLSVVVAVLAAATRFLFRLSKTARFALGILILPSRASPTHHPLFNPHHS